jgi:uncharacterized protein
MEALNRETGKRQVNPAQHILIFTVRLYRGTISPAKLFIFGPTGSCRFEPSCSAYALEALRAHGVLGGSWLVVRRICRCHPWGGCGHDPVPEVRSAGLQSSAPALATGRN